VIEVDQTRGRPVRTPDTLPRRIHLGVVDGRAALLALAFGNGVVSRHELRRGIAYANEGLMIPSSPAQASPLWINSNVSIATSELDARNCGPTHLTGAASRKLHRHFSSPALFRNTTDTSLRVTRPRVIS